MELTYQEIITIFNRLKLLNGHERVVKTDGVDKIINVPYQFNDSTAWNIAKNINVLRKLVLLYEEENKLLVETLKVDDKTINTDPEKYKTFIVELNKLLETKHPVTGLLKIKIAGLNLSQNPIQPGILAELADYLEE